MDINNSNILGISQLRAYVIQHCKSVEDYQAMFDDTSEFPTELA